ncbi:MAG: DNA polymerase III [Treponema sp.]|nr:DNA polymerase III [Treponema sp.]
MFDNLLFQNSSDLLEQDILSNSLPGAILLAGNPASGKLTCALELARILSCTADKKGEWMCECPSCRQHKSLTFSGILLTGPRDCILEISAAKKTFLQAVIEKAPYLNASRYLFLRSIRKLTLRFNSILWEGNSDLAKIAAITSVIDEKLEELDFPRELPASDELAKICDALEKKCMELESDFMYDSIPIMQIRNASSWAHISSVTGKKVIIIENADRMLEGVRNALLKILEEPPADTVFILTTTNRNAVMPTILSRVRTYNFAERTAVQQAQVIERVFHSNCDFTIERYLQEFLPIPPGAIREQAVKFMSVIAASKVPDIDEICKACGKFSIKIVLKLFLKDCLLQTKPLFKSAAGTATVQEVSSALRLCLDNVLIYKQSPQAALEQLVRELLKINSMRQGILSCMNS